jgi:hypothetical protein
MHPQADRVRLSIVRDLFLKQSGATRQPGALHLMAQEIGFVVFWTEISSVLIDAPR